MGKENPKINGVDEALKRFADLGGNGKPVPPPTLQERLARLYPEKGSAISDGTQQHAIEQALAAAMTMSKTRRNRPG